MPLSRKRSLIVGSDGFLGKNLANYFSKRGWEYFGIGRKKGDFTDAALVEELFSELKPVDRIFHVTTHQRTGQVQYQMQGALLATNAQVHLNILNAWRKYQPQAKLISTGSSCAYPESPKPLPEAAFQTGPLYDSVRGYGLAKQLLAVGSALFSEQYKLNYLHCILATLYGPHDHKESDRSHFFGGMLHRAVAEKREGKREFTVWGSPKTVRELLYVEDQIEAILAADEAFNNTLLNCAANAPLTIQDSAEAIRTTLNWDVPVVFPQATFQGTGYKVLDSTKFLGGVKWKPRFSLSQGIEIILKREYPDQMGL